MDVVRNRDRRRGDRFELKSQWRHSQSRKESILNCLLMGKRCFIYKNKGGIGSRWLDLLEEGSILVGIKCGSENNGSLFRWTYYCEGKRKLNNSSLFETTLSLKSEKYRRQKRGKMSVYYDKAIRVKLKKIISSLQIFLKWFLQGRLTATSMLDSAIPGSRYLVKCCLTEV